MKVQVIQDEGYCFRFRETAVEDESTNDAEQDISGRRDKTTEDREESVGPAKTKEGMSLARVTAESQQKS